MSTELAHALVKRVLTDVEFREQLEAAPIAEKRALLEAEGFGDVKLQHLSGALPTSAGGELSDEEFAAVAGGGKTTAIATAGVGSATATGVAAAVAIVGLGVV